MSLDLSAAFQFIASVDDISEFDEYDVSPLHEEKIVPLTRRHSVTALFFDSGTLLVDNFAYENRSSAVFILLEDIANSNIHVKSVGIASEEKLKRLINAKVTKEISRPKEIEFAQSIHQFQKLMQMAFDLNCQDVYIHCSKDKDLSFAQFKVNDSLLSETFPLSDYQFGVSVCRAAYDGGQSAGATRGSFDEVSLQEKQIKHTVYSNSGEIAAKLQLRYLKIPTSKMGELLINMRIQRDALRLDELGLDDGLYSIIKQKVSAARGGIITSGPTGSGKTTTMFAAFLERPKSEKLFTYEDPIEIEAPSEFTNVTQITMEADPSEQMRAINRMNPNGVYVQEMRDPASAKFAFGMMISGIPVLTTCHATSAPGVVERLLELKVPVQNIVADKSLSLLMSQVLVKRLCPRCAITLNSLEQEDAERFSIVAAKAKALHLSLSGEMMIRSEQGCSSCKGTGTIGRKLLIEYIELSDEDKDFIIRGEFVAWRKYLRTTNYNPIDKQCYEYARKGMMCTQDMLEYF